MNTNDFCILYVDDDENDVILVKSAAKSAGIGACLHTVTSGPEAIDYLQGHGRFADRQKFPMPKVILLDLRMPRMNGLEVLGWLHSQGHLVGIVVIIFSASSHPDDVQRACELGANAFVQKPSSIGDLIKFLQVVKTFWGGYHQFPPIDSGTLDVELPKAQLSP